MGPIDIKGPVFILAETIHLLLYLLSLDIHLFDQFFGICNEWPVQYGIMIGNANIDTTRTSTKPLECGVTKQTCQSDRGTKASTGYLTDSAVVCHGKCVNWRTSHKMKRDYMMARCGDDLTK
jgi:hypothetical protein